MANTKLKRMDRFELLEMIYNMRKANLDLTERLEAAEKKIEDIKQEADKRVDAVRAEYTLRIDDLRMQGAAKDLQKRMNEIEEQLIAFQRITGKDLLAGIREDIPNDAPAADAPAAEASADEAAEAAVSDPLQENGPESGPSAGESRG